MEFYIGNTDFEWFQYLRKIQPEDINFWQPGGLMHFKAISQGSPFLFRLKSPINKVAGIGFFSSHSILPITFAWEVFENRNGTDNYFDFYSSIKSYRVKENPLEKNTNVGCIVLTNPVFFREEDWITQPSDWAKSIVQGKTYNTINETGFNFWKRVEQVLIKYINIETTNQVNDPEPQYNQYLTKVRIGQGAFRILVTDAYFRRCAITGEKTLPVLEAAHIKSYATSGLNTINNGLLLRADLHKLFDNGYLTVTSEYKVEISRRIKEEFENGREYYKFHGNSLISLPSNANDLPNKDYLEWHNNTIYRSA